ncbi:uncharacterized protein LOC132904444 [Amyelois transitella]|uniref:uncharacterized protein LOC132904444 n=1 Tax=Amyelois transitella TaxID=680683 RepID=UPI00298FAF31|nr:uncharacterized protein LOC132904444 [Amyelois transitella]
MNKADKSVTELQPIAIGPVELWELYEDNCSGGSQCESGARASSTHTHTLDETNSYIQVVVQKQRRGRARLPAASSPAAAAPAPNKLHMEAERREDGGEECGEEGGWAEALRLLRARPPLLLLPSLAVAALPPAAAPSQNRDTHETHIKSECNENQQTGAGGGDSRAPQAGGLRPPSKPKSSWRLFNLDENNLDITNCEMTEAMVGAGPDGFEVYYFENAEASHLAACGGARLTAVERAAGPAQRRAAALLAELLAAARLLIAAPVALFLALLRCLLETQRSVVCGLVQTWSDYALKPALAMLYNAVLHPPLVFAGSAARGSRAALRPALAALGDALQPLARVLGAVRLVHVHVERAPCRCECKMHTEDDSNV